MSASKAFHEEFAARVIAMLENGTAPWQKSWTPAKELAPYNPISGVTYRGGNRLWLSMLSTGDPRWMTFKQAVKAGYKIRKGSKSVPIEYFVTQVTEDRLDENGRPILDEDGNPERVTRRLERPMLKIHRVFNAQDVEGLPPSKCPSRSMNGNRWKKLRKSCPGRGPSSSTIRRIARSTALRGMRFTSRPGATLTRPTNTMPRRSMSLATGRVTKAAWIVRSGYAVRKATPRRNCGRK